MTVKIIRGTFVLACIIMGGIWAGYLADAAAQESAEPSSSLPWLIIGGVLGGGIAILVLFLLSFITQELYEKLAPAIVAVVAAMVIGYVIAQYTILWFPDWDKNLQFFLVVSLVLVFSFIGISLGLTRASKLDLMISQVEMRNRPTGIPKVVDTSVLIDGRIQDICDTGFVEGTLLVPRFVLRELQNIADSSDVLRRAKGRRGLDILRALQEGESRIEVEILEEDPADAREVDAKIVRIASKYNARILTTDFNLNKVAQIEGIHVLNINELANAMKPAYLPDEEMQVKIIKEGKDPSQGVGYLDDGTMVVVDGGRDYIGKKVDAAVTSVLQTAAGRMIFTRFKKVLT